MKQRTILTGLELYDVRMGSSYLLVREHRPEDPNIRSEEE